MNEAHITSMHEVVKALGGTSAVARLTGRKPQNVSNWKASGHFPPNTFTTLTKALEDRGCTAPPSLWRIA